MTKKSGEKTFFQRHWIMGTTLRLIRITVTLTVFLLSVGVAGLMVVYFHFAKDLPNIKTLADYKPPVVSEVFARDGTKIGEFWTERRLVSSLNEIPSRLVQGFIASEDARFFEHHGVDIIGIFRAIWIDVQAGSFVQGASTITQQITRSILLSRERHLDRKVKEAILATRIERNLNKEQILTLYLNQIFLGNRAYGVRSAAENYFHKEMKDLTIAEIAMIAGLSRGPAEDNPVRNPQRAKMRQHYVLDRMRELDFITKAEYTAALTEPLTIYAAGIDKDFNARFTPYFTEHVRRKLLEEYGEKAVYEGGLKIATTVDLNNYRNAEMALRWGLEELDHRQGYRGPVKNGVTRSEAEALCQEVHEQALVEQGDRVMHIPELPEDRARATGPTPMNPIYNYRAVVTDNAGGVKIRVGNNLGTLPEKLNWSRRHFAVGDVIEVRATANPAEFALTETPAVQGALFSMDIKTGFVSSMIGGYDYRQSEFNRATQSVRQPGSSFKPFVYASALDKGFTYSTPVADSPVAYRTGLNQIWSPKNYGNSYSGVGPFSSHITFSRNVPTVKIAHTIGLHYLTGFVRKMGLTSPIGKYLSMALGANGVYMNEMVDAYATFPNGGVRPHQLFITKITDLQGALVKEYLPPQETTQIIKLVDQEKNNDVAESELNQTLWHDNEHWIKDDGLSLDPQEKLVLYGSRIPEGHTITPQTAYLMVGLMRKVVEQGTGQRVKALGRPVAGKTGTTNDETDTWFIGYTPEIVTAIWVGYDSLKRLGPGEQGGRTAAPIWLKYMQPVVQGTPITDFQPPPDFPLAKMASLTGGSASYWRGGTADELSEEVRQITTRKTTDRAINFSQDDFENF